LAILVSLGFRGEAQGALKTAFFRFSRESRAAFSESECVNQPRFASSCFIQRIGGSHSLAADEPRLSFYEFVRVDNVTAPRTRGIRMNSSPSVFPSFSFTAEL